MKPTTTLKRSSDRKVSNLIQNGRAKIANSFGLPAGKSYSCPGATSICERVCYAGKAGGIEQIYPNSFKLVLHNWEILRNMDQAQMEDELDKMINDFETECSKWGAKQAFRIHWDGDFFNQTYIQAWHTIISEHTETRFWAYTRVPDAAKYLHGLPNLAIYFSSDKENYQIGEILNAFYGIPIAMMADTFQEAKDLLGGAISAKCPELLKTIPLEGACIKCGLCLKGKHNIRFSITRK